MMRARDEPGAGAAAARRGAGEGGAVGVSGIFNEALNDELTARLNAVVVGLTRCAQELRELTGAGEEHKEEVVLGDVSSEASGLDGCGGGGGGGDDDKSNDDSDDAEVAAVAMSVAVAAARRRPIPRSAGPPSCAGAGAGDEGCSGLGGLTAPRPSPEPWAVPRGRLGGGGPGSTSSSYVFRAGTETGDWRERVPTTPPPGRARAYPRKPERSLFELPTALNQRDAPRSLVEWYMTRVYDPVQVTERAQLLAERREKEHEQNLPASLPNSPSSLGVADDSASDCPTEASGETVVAAEEYAPSRPATGVGAGAVPRASATPTPTSVPAAYCYLPTGPEVPLTSGPLCVEVPPGAAWNPADAHLQPHPQAYQPPHPPAPSQHQIQSELQRNRAHVMGSSLQLGDREEHPAHANNLSHSTAPLDERPSRARPGTAAVPETLGAASDAIARERRRIRRKVLGGGVRPDWFNFDDVPEETPAPAAAAAPSPASTPPTPPTPPQAIVMTPTSPFPIAPQWVNADGQPIAFMPPQPFLQHPGMAVPGFPPQNMYYIVPKQDASGHSVAAPMECGMFYNYPNNAMIQIMPTPSQTQMLDCQGDAASPSYLVQRQSKEQVLSDANSSGDAPSSNLNEKVSEALEKDVKEALPFTSATDASDTDTPDAALASAGADADADADTDTDADAAAPKRKPAKKRRSKSKQQGERRGARAGRPESAQSQEALDSGTASAASAASPAAGPRDRLAKAASSAALRHVSIAPLAAAAAASRSRFVNDAVAGGTVRRMTQRARDLGLGAAAAAEARDAREAPHTPVLDARQTPRRSASSSQHALPSAQRLFAGPTTEAPLAAGDTTDGDIKAVTRAQDPAGRPSLRSKLALTDEMLLSRPPTATKLKKAATSMTLMKGEPGTKPRPPKRENTFSLSSAHSTARP